MRQTSSQSKAVLNNPVAHFAAVSMVCLGVLFVLREKLSGILPAGSTYSLTLLVYIFSLRYKPYKKIVSYALLTALAIAILGWAIPEGITSTSLYLLAIQIVAFSVWTTGLFMLLGWNRLTHSIWTLSALIQLLILPSLSLTHSIQIFGFVILLTLWFSQLQSDQWSSSKS